jgi:cobyrinic acid a,c-diamide synthase
VLGAVPREAALALPERHLGLVQAGEHADLATLIDRLAANGRAPSRSQRRCYRRCAACTSPLAPNAELCSRCRRPASASRWRSDRAFSFVYPHLVDAWRRAGAEIMPFSPLADEPPPESADCCWLPGGYPELHADALAAAQRFAEGCGAFAETRPVHGECGGYMVLGESLEDAAGN